MCKNHDILLAIERNWRLTEDIADVTGHTIAYTRGVLLDLVETRKVEMREFLGYFYWRSVWN